MKPMEQIDDIKILHVEGLHGPSVSGSDNGIGGSVADQAVNAALKYRTQAPLLDSLMAELGLEGADLNGLVGGVNKSKDG